MTQHADDYSRCVGIKHIGWNAPKGNGIDALIVRTGVYPFTILPGLTRKEVSALRSSRVITLGDVIGLESWGLSRERLMELKGLARQIVG